MVQLSSLKQKISVQLVFIIVLYLVAVIVLGAIYWPTRQDARLLTAQIDQMARSEQNLRRIVEQRPSLEREMRELEQSLFVLERNVPSQYDLPQVLEYLKQLGNHYAITVGDLDHLPVQIASENMQGVVPLSFIIEGEQEVLSYIIQIQAVLPSLQFRAIQLSYTGAGTFTSEVHADLGVALVENAQASRWITPQLVPNEVVNLNVTAFGLPFEQIAQFAPQNVQLLGVVEAGAQSSALIAKDGARSWVQVGDYLGQAIISSIYASEVWLDVDGVQIKLTIGG